MKSIFKYIRTYMDNDPRLKPYLLMWLRKTTKTIDKWPQEKLIKGVMDCYERRMGYRFDLSNPILFNEKLQWYKIYYKRDDFGYITDKVTFKDYIKGRLGDGFTIPMYGWWDDIKDFEKDWDKLPETLVLKSNLAANASGVLIIKHRSEENLKDVIRKVKPWLKPWNTLVNSWDCHFYNSTPKILAEKFMEDESGELRDYKFFCFNGEVPYYKVDYSRFKHHHANYYDSDYKPVDLDEVGCERDLSVDITLPETIVNMMSLAKELSVGFPFIRIDFFTCQGKIYLSEFTFAPGGGTIHYPDWFNKKLGDMFVLPQY